MLAREAVQGGLFRWETQHKHTFGAWATWQATGVGLPTGSRASHSPGLSPASHALHDGRRLSREERVRGGPAVNLPELHSSM